jgi:C4-dicarboxylate-specific signal transduction histidine kinase
MQQGEQVILVVDDEPAILDTYRLYLDVEPAQGLRSSRAGRVAAPAPVAGVRPRLLLCGSGEEAVEAVQQVIARGGEIAAGFFDMKMPGGIDGLETIRKVRALDPRVLCTIVTAYHDRSLDEINAVFAGGHEDEWDYLSKPFTEEEILQKTRNVVSSWLRRRKEEQQLSDLEELIDHISGIKGLRFAELMALLENVLQRLVDFTGSRGGMLATLAGDAQFQVGVGAMRTPRLARAALEQSTLERVVASAMEVADSIYTDGNISAVAIRCVKAHRSVLLLQAGPLSPEKQRLLRIFAENASAAIDNQELYDELQRFNDRLEQEVERRTETLQFVNQELEKRSGELETALSELRAAQTQLVQNEKLAVVGQLAAGVAHEINNPCAFVLGNLAELRNLVADGTSTSSGEATAMVSDAIDGMNRIAGIVRDLSFLSRTDADQSEAVDLNAVVERVLHIMARQIEGKATLVAHRQAVPPVTGSGARLVQVVLNLVSNALHSMTSPDRSANHLGIATARCGAEVHVTVEDSGEGIPPDIIDRIFDPFFSTKAVGQGSGLGLSISRGIVEQHGGRIEVSSQPGGGTRFVVALPAAKASVPAPAPRGAPAIPSTPVAGAPRILFVDDEPAILRCYRRRYERQGYRVDLAASGAEALALLDGRTDVYQVIVCDLMMPELTGRDVFEQMLARAPELRERFVFMSGGAFVPSIQEFLARETPPLVEKGISLYQLDLAIGDIAARATRGNRS